MAYVVMAYEIDAGRDGKELSLSLTAIRFLICDILQAKSHIEISR